MSTYHIPVMPKETIELLNVQKGHWYIDCNLGGGGHTELILQQGGKVIGIDLDAEAIHEVAKNHSLEVVEVNGHIEAHSENLILYQSNFADIDQVISSLRDHEMTKQSLKISGILFDLGVSTHQLEIDARGFSFNKDAPLDMRMDQSKGLSAKELVNGLYEKELAELFLKLGEENWHKPIAKKIAEYRKTKSIETTNELANIILSVRRRTPSDRTHPATRVFQALRIAVNDELNSLKLALPKAFEVLAPEGRLVVISFHSLEDRIVKNYFASLCHSREGGNPENEENWIPDRVRDDNVKIQAKLLTKKPIETSEEEALENPRSRSAKLRGIEKV